jgi:peptide/nickel transport system permease protein
VLSGWRVRHQTAIEESKYNVRIFFRDPLAVTGLFIIFVVLLIGLLAPLIAPYPDQGQGAAHLATRFASPSASHLLGCDNYGRDVLSRIMFGARIPLLIGALVIGGCLAIGVPLGGIAGYYGGRLDELIMRITDVFLAFPNVLLAMAFVAFIGPGLRNVIIALIISWWPWYTRIVRGVAISLRERPYIEAAQTMGVPRLMTVFRHILPGAMGPIIVQASIDLGSVILAAAALSFIGLGAQPPTAEWGLMVNEGREFILSQWWIATFPALAMFVLVLGANLVGDGLRDVLDPRSKR